MVIQHVTFGGNWRRGTTPLCNICVSSCKSIIASNKQVKVKDDGKKFLENDKHKHIMMSHYDSLAIINFWKRERFFISKTVDDMNSLIFLNFKI